MYIFRKRYCKEGHLLDPSWRKCPICLAPITAWLVVMDGEDKGKIYSIHEGNNKIGTGSDCEVRILKGNLSRQHVFLKCDNRVYTITDLNSISGTYVNNRKISSSNLIDGDIIKMGILEFKFKCL